MSNNVPPSVKCCVTCQYWGGQRKTSVFRDRAEHKDERVSGECLGSGMDRMQKTALAHCQKWEKWSILK